jgi:multidrug efflux pump
VASGLFRVDDGQRRDRWATCATQRIESGHGRRGLHRGRNGLAGLFADRGRLDADALRDGPRKSAILTVPVTPNERIEALAAWIEADTPFPAGIAWEWAGDQEEQAESQAFLSQAFGAALGLMFIILLAQFNSVYNAVLVLLAVVLSTTGVLIGMLVMDQTFSIIMTGTGIVALAGIVVNNNIVLIDTYQEYSATCRGSRRSPARPRRASARSC